MFPVISEQVSGGSASFMGIQEISKKIYKDFQSGTMGSKFQVVPEF